MVWWIVVVVVVVVVFIISFHFLVWCMKVSRESSSAYMKLVWWIGDWVPGKEIYKYIYIYRYVPGKKTWLEDQLESWPIKIILLNVLCGLAHPSNQQKYHQIVRQIFCCACELWSEALVSVGEDVLVLVMMPLLGKVIVMSMVIVRMISTVIVRVISTVIVMSMVRVMSTVRVLMTIFKQVPTLNMSPTSRSQGKSDPQSLSWFKLFI